MSAALVGVTQAARDAELTYLVKLADWAAGAGFCQIEGLEDPEEWCFRMWDLHGNDGGTGDGYSADALAAVVIARAINEAELRGARLMQEAAWEVVRFADVPASELIKRKFAKEIRALDPATLMARATLTETSHAR